MRTEELHLRKRRCISGDDYLCGPGKVQKWTLSNCIIQVNVSEDSIRLY